MNNEKPAKRASLDFVAIPQGDCEEYSNTNDDSFDINDEHILKNYNHMPDTIGLVYIKDYYEHIRIKSTDIVVTKTEEIIIEKFDSAKTYASEKELEKEESIIDMLLRLEK